MAPSRRIIKRGGVVYDPSYTRPERVNRGDRFFEFPPRAGVELRKQFSRLRRELREACTGGTVSILAKFGRAVTLYTSKRPRNLAYVEIHIGIHHDPYVIST